MALAKLNYVVVYDNSPQVYCSSTLETVIDAPNPKNTADADKKILFVSYFPDTKELKVFEVTDEEIAAKRIEVAETMARREEKRKLKEEKVPDAESQVTDLQSGV